GIVGDPQEVVADAEAPGLRGRELLQAARRRPVDVAAARRADVARDALRAPAVVVGRGDVREEVEAELVAQVQRRLHEACPVDDEGRLAVRLLDLDQPRNAAVVQLATPRISYAGGTTASIFSWSRTMPSINASGRGGQPGTWMSTATILSAPTRPPSRASSGRPRAPSPRPPARRRWAPSSARAAARTSGRDPADGLLPLERALPPDVDVRDHQDRDEEEELDEAEPGELVEDDRERIQED